MIENVDKYLKPGGLDNIDEIRQSVLAQFGPDYCVLSTSIAFHMVAACYLVEMRARAGDPVDNEAAVKFAKMNAGAIKGALIGAGFDGNDALQVIKALLVEAHEND